MLAQLFQVNPLHWIYQPDKTPLKTPQDLKGRIIGILYGGDDETIMRALMAKYDIKEDEVELFSVRYNYTILPGESRSVAPHRNVPGTHYR